VEWWFYFTLPLLALGFRWLRWWLLLAGRAAVRAAVSLLVRTVAGRGALGHRLQLRPIMHLRARYDEFFLGVLAAWFHLAAPATARVRGLLAGTRARRPGGAGGRRSRRAATCSCAQDYPWVLVHYTVVGTLLAGAGLGRRGRACAGSTHCSRTGSWPGSG
jgi:hypothetical protein